MESKKPAVEISGLRKEFSLRWMRGRLVAVEGLDLVVPEGEVFGLLGPNGSGKSTTMKMMLGLVRPTRGTVSVCGHRAGTMAARKAIGFLPENPYFPEFLTAKEVLGYYGPLCGLRGKALARRSEELLEMVGLAQADNRPLRTFSKGMLQRIGLAQALLHDPRVLLLDEPTAGVDPMGSRQIRDLILEISKQGRTVIFSSHLLDQVQDVADRVAIMNLGRKLCEGTLEELLTVKEKARLVCPEPSEAARKEVLEVLARHGVKDAGWSSPHQRLEDFFASVVRGAK